MRAILTGAMSDAIRGRVNGLSSEKRGSAALASRLGVLPVYEGWTGVFALTLSGEIIFVDEEVGPPYRQPEEDLVWLAIALVRASSRYPELAGLLPIRPSGRPDCPKCHGAGKVQTFSCGGCGELGWMPESPGELGLVP